MVVTSEPTSTGWYLRDDHRSNWHRYADPSKISLRYSKPRDKGGPKQLAMPVSPQTTLKILVRGKDCC